MVERGETDVCNISSCYKFFYKHISGKIPNLESLHTMLTKKLSLVSIVLGPNDDPHVVFESLNYKGKPLSSADLIRNYFFMKVHVNEQNTVYDEIWKPMQDSLQDALPEFVRHYLMKDGDFVRVSDVYALLKERINKSPNAKECMMDLKKYSSYYSKLLHPELETNKVISKKLKELNRLDMTTSYTFLLNAYDCRGQAKL